MGAAAGLVLSVGLRTVWKLQTFTLTIFSQNYILYTVWKFHDFCIIQILREINFEDTRSAKSAILPHLEALNFDIYEFLHFFQAEICQMNKIHSP